MILLTYLNWLLLVTAGYWFAAMACLLVLSGLLDREQRVSAFDADLMDGDQAEDFRQTESSDVMAEAQAPARASFCAPIPLVDSGFIESPQQPCY